MKASEILEKEEKQPTYSVQVECINCGRQSYEEIPRGEPLRSWLQSKECPRCGCKVGP